MNKDTTITYLPIHDTTTHLRVESTAPTAYRLMEKRYGGLVLQGAYAWNDGTHCGFEWRDIPTEKEAT